MNIVVYLIITLNINSILIFFQKFIFNLIKYLSFNKINLIISTVKYLKKLICKRKIRRKINIKLMKYDQNIF